MTMVYSHEDRAMKAMKLGQRKAKGDSVAAACAAAGISPSTFYTWRAAFDKEGPWSKRLLAHAVDLGGRPGKQMVRLAFDKEGGYSKG
jgi:transposase-like protein